MPQEGVLALRESIASTPSRILSTQVPSSRARFQPSIPSIPHGLDDFPDECLNSVDWTFLQHLLQFQISDHLGAKSSTVLLVRPLLWETARRSNPVETAFPWPDFNLSSTAFRFAALAFASYVPESEISTHTLRYLDKAYKYVREAVSSSSLVEVAAASYVILLYEYVSSESLEKLLVLFKGLCSALMALQFATLPPSDRTLLYNLWHNSVQAIRRASWALKEAKVSVSEQELSLLAEMHKILASTSFMFSLLSSFDVTQPTHACMDVETLESYLSMYWDYYLAVRNDIPNRLQDSQSSFGKRVVFIETSIREIFHLIHFFVLQQPTAGLLITQATRHVSTETNFFDYPELVLPTGAKYENVKAAVLFCWAKVLENAMVRSTHSYGNLAAVHSSIVLLRLCRSGFFLSPEGWSGYSITRSLFWCGLNLTNQVSPSGKPLLAGDNSSEQLDFF